MQKLFLPILFVLYFKTGKSQSDSLPPGSIGYRLTKAIEKARLKDYDKAILIVDSAMAIDSSNEHIFALKSELLWMKKDYYAAALCYRRAMTLDKDSSYLKGAHLFLGVLYEKAGFRDKAQNYYLKAIELFENYKRKDDRFFENSNGINYAVALILSGTQRGWKGLMSSSKFDRYKELYKGKSREQVLEAYWKEYDGG
jgi:tetratricopeptide (TPR) repeat protein